MSNRFAPDGFQYGVRFHDGSVSHQWTGRTQRKRAEEELAYLRDEYKRDTFALVRRGGTTWPWEAVDEK